jgi:hypothetical protein
VFLVWCVFGGCGLVVKKKGDCGRVLLSVLDESMESIFGRSAAEAVFYHLEKCYILKHVDILEKPEVFSEAIEGMFGEVGAEVIEGLLVMDLLARLKEECEGADEIMRWLDRLRGCSGVKK